MSIDTSTNKKTRHFKDQSEQQAQADGKRTAYLAVVNECEQPGGAENPWYQAAASIAEAIKMGLEHIEETTDQPDKVPGTAVWVFKVDKLLEDGATSHVQPVIWQTPDGSYAQYGSEIETAEMKQDWEAMHYYARVWYNGEVISFLKTSQQYQMLVALGVVDPIETVKTFTGPDYLSPASIRTFSKARAQKLGTASLTDIADRERGLNKTDSDS